MDFDKAKQLLASYTNEQRKSHGTADDERDCPAGGSPAGLEGGRAARAIC